MSDASGGSRSPWAWVPSLYLAEGLPYVMVMTVSVILYKKLGVSNTELALWTSWLYLPWVVKPLWSPVVDLLGTRRRWIWAMQLMLGAGLAGVALSLPGPHFFLASIACFWVMALLSATHDIAADGFYMLGTTEAEQSAFVGVRNMFYRFAMLAAQGPFVILVGRLEQRSGDVRHAWSVSIAALAALFVGFGLWHRWVLPRPASDAPGDSREIPRFVGEFLATFGDFFRKPRIAVIVAFLLLYRFGEAQLVKMAAPFLLDARAAGGLGLSTAEVGFLYGTIGVIALIAGGLLGGFVISRDGLKRWLWPMLVAIHLPDAAFIWLAYAQPTNLTLVQACIGIEQFGYGFGFTAYLMAMISISQGRHRTAHYAICTGFMAMGMMFPGMWSGWLQDHIGYRHFFSWVVLATVPSFLVAMFLPLEAGFGKRSAS
jgi:PAT family beta-lactamase induction signal transducer AmpG